MKMPDAPGMEKHAGNGQGFFAQRYINNRGVSPSPSPFSKPFGTGFSRRGRGSRRRPFAIARRRVSDGRVRHDSQLQLPLPILLLSARGETCGEYAAHYPQVVDRASVYRDLVYLAVIVSSVLTIGFYMSAILCLMWKARWSAL